MKIAEIFYSIQGESTYSGLPCLFIRTSGCNLNCFYCDTKYARTPKYQLTNDEILKKINNLSHTKLIEITGGEPLLQEDIYLLFQLLHEHKFQILLETNGSRDLKKVPEFVAKIIDVKTPSSGHSDSFKFSNLNYLHPEKDNLKFVLSNLNDYQWMKNFLQINHISGPYILVSPVFSTINPQTLVENILKDGINVRFQLQLHKYIWDPTKIGV